MSAVRKKHATDGKFLLNVFFKWFQTSGGFSKWKDFYFFNILSISYPFLILFFAASLITKLEPIPDLTLKDVRITGCEIMK